MSSFVDLVLNFPSKKHTREAKFDLEQATVRATDMTGHVKMLACIRLCALATQLPLIAPGWPRDGVSMAIIYHLSAAY